MTPTKSKNFKLATEFYDYCCAHPELRFWQALHAWSEISNIFAGSFLVSRDSTQFTKNMKDTFYWEEKDK